VRPAPITLDQARTEHDQAKEAVRALTTGNLDRARIGFQAGPIGMRLDALQQRITTRIGELNTLYRAGTINPEVQQLPDFQTLARDVANTRRDVQLADNPLRGAGVVLARGGDALSTAAGTVVNGFEVVYRYTLAPILSALGSMSRPVRDLIKRALGAPGVNPTVAAVANAALDGGTAQQTPEQLAAETNFTAVMGLVTNNGLQLAVPEGPKQTLLTELDALVSLYRSRTGDNNVTRDAYVLLVIDAAKTANRTKTGYTWAELMTVARERVNATAVRIAMPTPAPAPAPAPAPVPPAPGLTPPPAPRP
jgi:hypothetical protein